MGRGATGAPELDPEVVEEIEERNISTEWVDTYAV